MNARRFAFGRLCLTESQMRVLLVFDAYRRRLAGRPTRPTLTEVGMEAGGISIAGVKAHVAALGHKGYLQQTAVFERRSFQLTEKGLAWVKAKRRRLARIEKRTPRHPVTRRPASGI